MTENDREDAKKKYWWLLGIVVPLAVALIAALPTLFDGAETEPDLPLAMVPEKQSALADRREEFYWNHIENLTDILENRIDRDSDRFTFSRFFDGCEQIRRRAAREYWQPSALSVAGLGVQEVSEVNPLSLSIKDLENDADQAFKTLDSIGKALTSDSLRNLVLLIEVRSSPSRQGTYVDVYSEVAADAVREYLVVKFGISRCRVVARGGGVPYSDEDLGDVFTFSSFRPATPADDRRGMP